MTSQFQVRPRGIRTAFIIYAAIYLANKVKRAGSSAFMLNGNLSIPNRSRFTLVDIFTEHKQTFISLMPNFHDFELSALEDNHSFFKSCGYQR